MNDEANWQEAKGSAADASARSLPYEAHADLIIGKRAEQQDAVRLACVPDKCGQDALLVVVADGMGGHVGGAEASRRAVEAYIDAYGSFAENPPDLRLRDALDRANEAIHAGFLANAELKGMGCTIVAAVQTGRHIRWISVGDTILAEVRQGVVRRLNADHSMAPLLDAQVQRGEITAEEARTSEQRHMLRAALTGRHIAMVDEGEIHLSAGSLLFAATDGIHTLDSATIGAIVEQGADPCQAIERLLKAIASDMPVDQDNTAIAMSRIPGTVTRRIDCEPVPRPAGSLKWPLVVLVLGVLVAVAAGALYGDMIVNY